MGIAYRSSTAYRYVIISIWKNVFFRGVSIRVRVNLWIEFSDRSGLLSIAYLLSIAIKTVSMAYGKMYFSEV